MPYVRAIAVGAVVIGFLLIGLPWRWTRKTLGLERDSRLSVWFCRTLCWLLRIRIVERGAPPAAHPTLIVSNHVSWSDVLALGANRSLCFLAKKEVASWPAFGALAQAQGCVFVDRERRMQIPRVNSEIADRLLAGEAVVLFAEATTSDGTRVRKFHSSHIAAARDALDRDPALDRIRVQPASIVHLNRHGLPLGRSGRAATAWYGDMTFLPSLWALLSAGPIDCEIAYGAPIDFLRGTDRKAVARQAEASVRRLVGQSLTGREPPARTAGEILAAPENA